MGEKVLKKRGYVFAFKSAHKVLRRVSFGILKFFGGVKQAIKKTHDKTYNKIGWYKKWSDSKTSETVHRALTIWLSLVVFVVLSITVLFTAPINTTLQAANRSVSWSTKGDFENNASTTNTPTTGDCVVDGTNPEDDATITMPKGRTDTFLGWGNDIRQAEAYNTIARVYHSAVWTGTKMIIWGGQDDNGNYPNYPLLYDPLNGSWQEMSSDNAPVGRTQHTAVWTGTKMIIWGGTDSDGSPLNSGGIYDPANDIWTDISLNGAPEGRYNSTTVWASTEMIVWGGFNYDWQLLNTGASYNVSSNTWREISTQDAPLARGSHTSVWTGTRMIVWGGETSEGITNTGGVYDPTLDVWETTNIIDAPSGRYSHTVVWTGTEMIIWGGYDNDTGYTTIGAIYNPTSDTWLSTNTNGAPDGRFAHTAVWTGSRMIIWGGANYFGTPLDSGGSYDPLADTWSSLSLHDVPTARTWFPAVWADSRLIIWGGQVSLGLTNSGSIYDPISDKWMTTDFNIIPHERNLHSTVWTGYKMIVWGGVGSDWQSTNSGEIYNPATNVWMPISTEGAPAARTSPTAVWTGSKMIVWGGYSSENGQSTDTGGIYDPITDEWTAMSLESAPTARYYQTAVWAGSKMIVWGGYEASGYAVNTGASYDPTTDTWTEVNPNHGLPPRAVHTAISTGSKMIIWGGYDNQSDTRTNTGGIYDPTSDTWADTSITNAPSLRDSHSAVWTGTKMIIWGGTSQYASEMATGGIYDPISDSWTETSMVGAPQARFNHSAVWTGIKMIIWGGEKQGVNPKNNTGGVYNPSLNDWNTVDTVGAPSARTFHSAVWSGSGMIIFGGDSVDGVVNDGKMSLADVADVYSADLYKQNCSISGIKINTGVGQKVTWSNIDWNMQPLPGGASIGVRSRSAVFEAGLSNANWSDVVRVESIGESYGNMDITSASNQWLEIEFILESFDGTGAPILEDFTLYYTELSAPLDLADQTDLYQFDSVGNNIGLGAGVRFSEEIWVGDIMADCQGTICWTQFEIKKTEEEFDGNNLIDGTQNSDYGVSYIEIPFIPTGAYSYKWRARVTDVSGTVSPWTAFNGGRAAFYVDIIPPVGTLIIENGNTRTNSTTVRLDVDAADSGAGVDLVKFSNDGVEWSDWEDYENVKTNGKIWHLLDGNGVRSVHAQFMDKVGNISGNTWQTKADFENNNGVTSEINRESIKINGADGNSFALPAIQSSYQEFLQVAPGAYNHSIALDINGRLWATGRNTEGQLGTGDTSSTNTWVPSNIDDGKKIATAWYSSYVLKKDNTLWSVGANDSGELGLNYSSTVHMLQWTQALDEVEDFWVREGSFIIAKKLDGTYWFVGESWGGNFGIETPPNYLAQWTEAPEIFNDIKKIEVGHNCTMFLKNSGELYATGTNNYGALGLGDYIERYTFNLSATNVSDFGLSSDCHQAFLKNNNGQIMSTGNAESNGLGADASTWTNVPDIDNVSEFLLGHDETIIKKNDGSLWAIGRNSYGALGVGNNNPVTQWTSLNINNPIVVSSGNGNLQIIKSDYTLWAAGRNSNGQLGIGNNTHAYTFTMASETVYAESGVIGGDPPNVGLRYVGAMDIKWSSLRMDSNIDSGQGIKFAVRISDDGVNWGELLGRDGAAINWGTNYFGYVADEGTEYLSLNNIPSSKYIDITVRMETSINSTPVLKSVSLDLPSRGQIEINSIPATVYFDPNKKYPAEDWNIKENVNSVDFRFTTGKITVAYVDFGGPDVTKEVAGDPLFGVNHSLRVRSLKPNTTYKYRLRTIDSFDNMTLLPEDADTNLNSYYTFTTGRTDEGFEGTPSVTDMAQVEITASTAKITWRTKVPTSSWVDFGETIDFGSMAGEESLTTAHVVELRNLIAGKTYYYRVRGIDAGENEFISSGFSFVAIMKPEILDVKSENITQNSAEISWTTNVKTDSDVAYGIANLSDRVKDVGFLTSHRVTLKDLNDDFLYQYQVEARDSFGNITKSQLMSFRTILDTAGPTIEDVRIETIPVESNQTTAQIIMSWKTNKPATTKIEYGEGVIGGTYEKASTGDPSLNINHTVIIKELNPAASYHFRIVSKDKRDNMTKSTDYTIVTPAAQKSIWQLILASLQNTFSWVQDMPKFWSSVGEKIR